MSSDGSVGVPARSTVVVQLDCALNVLSPETTLTFCQVYCTETWVLLRVTLRFLASTTTSLLLPAFTPTKVSLSVADSALCQLPLTLTVPVASPPSGKGQPLP